ncbi:MAG TPA: amidohydrolase [Candidatus Obscuribacterales bacterium]
MAAELTKAADLVLTGGAVYTMDAPRSWAEAVAIEGGRIVYVGPNSGAQKYIGKDTKLMELNGKMVLPGFQDSHVHPAWGGVEQARCVLNDLYSPEEIYRAIADYAAKHPDSKWIVGGGWPLTAFPEANPKKEELDRIVPDRPVYLESADCHSAWVNSRALALAGVTKDTADPHHGRIERDPSTGEPSGTLRELAMDLVEKLVPQPSADELIAGVKRAQQMANRFGITTVQDAMVDAEILAAYKELDRRGELTLRVVASLYVDPLKDDSQVTDLVKLRDGATSAHVRARTVKIFADGVLETCTAALLEPYAGRGDFWGELNFEPERLTRLVTTLDREQFQVHIHALGDRATRTALDAHEAAQRANGRRDARHHIAHLQLVHPDDLPRFRQLGIIANFQPYWCQRDDYVARLTEPKLGPERSKRLYPIRSMVKTGALIAAGSDWPVSSMNPLDAIQVAVTRRDLESESGEPWLPDEVVDLPTILAAYTINGAYVNWQENDTGSIETGKAADLIVIDRNLFAIPAHEIHKCRVLLTLLAGKEVFRDPAF